MTGSDGVVDLQRRALLQSARVVAGVQPEQLAWPTPCTEFDVRTLIGHMLFAARRTTQAARRDELSTDGAAVTGLADSGWAAEFENAAAEAAEAWDSSGALDGDIVLPFGTFPAPVVAQIYTIEQATHAWDLAAATGLEAGLDGDLADASLAIARQIVPDEFRGGPDMPFGPVVEVPADAAPYDKLAGYLGRDPSFRAGRVG